jgi:DNA-binding transcriptional LysR family regulator
MDWDNLRYFLELARTRKLTSAARRLDVQHTTVARRIRALEQGVGAPLFLRVGGEYTLSEVGRSLLPHAEAMESASRRFDGDRSQSATLGELSGLVRVGATEGFGTMVLAPLLARFAVQHPRLVIDLLAVPRNVNLSRREADIVVSLERPSHSGAIVARLCDYVLRLYASSAYLEQHPTIQSREDLSQHHFIGYIDDLLFSKELRYLEELSRPRLYALRSTSVLAQHQAVASGAGVGVLPAFLADGDGRLRQVLPDEASFVRTFWISMSSENRSVARMQAVWALLRSVRGSDGLLRDASYSP